MGRIYFDGGCGFGLLLVTDYADPRLREDKPPAEADSIQTVRRLFEQQFRYKGRLV